MSLSICIYSYSSCSTCRKALSWLSENDIQYDLIDIVQNPPSKDILRKAIENLGNRKLLFNTSGLSYRKLGATVIKSMSDEEVLDALSSDGKLIKRPFLVAGNGKKFLTGFKLDLWEQFFRV